MEHFLQKNRELLSEEQWIREMAGSGQRLSISLTNDFAFKTAFRNKKALKGLLSALLDIEVEEIRELEFPNLSLETEYPDEKEGILDVKILLNGVKKINIEIQVLPFPFWEERSLYYTARHFVEGLKKGEHYKELNATVHVSILSFLLKEECGLFSVYELRERKNHRLYSDKISLRVLQLKRVGFASEEERESEIYQWAKMISTNDWEVLQEMAKQNEYMQEAVEEIEKINTEEELRYLYLLREKRIRDEATVRMFEREEGHQQGLQCGERIKLISQVRKKLLKGKSADEIAEDLEESTDLIQEICLAISTYPSVGDDETDRQMSEGQE